MMLTYLSETIGVFRARETGAIGMLVLGIVVGVVLVIFGIIKFLIPGE